MLVRFLHALAVALTAPLAYAAEQVVLSHAAAVCSGATAESPANATSPP